MSSWTGVSNTVASGFIILAKMDCTISLPTSKYERDLSVSSHQNLWQKIGLNTLRITQNTNLQLIVGAPQSKLISLKWKYSGKVQVLQCTVSKATEWMYYYPSWMINTSKNTSKKFEFLLGLGTQIVNYIDSWILLVRYLCWSGRQ